MQVYTVTAPFDFSQLGIEMSIGMTIGKIGSRTSVFVNSVEYANQAIWNWVGTADSLNYLLFVGTLPDPAIPGTATVKTGSVAITSGNDFATLTGAAWGFIPSGYAVVVTKPNGGDNLFATVRAASVTADGFTADLSAPASGSGYSLVYVVAE